MLISMLAFNILLKNCADRFFFQYDLILSRRHHFRNKRKHILPKFSFMKIFDSSLSFSPAEAQAKFYSITKTVVQNSGLHNTSWYVFKLANPDEIVT